MTIYCNDLPNFIARHIDSCDTYMLYQTAKAFIADNWQFILIVLVTMLTIRFAIRTLAHTAAFIAFMREARKDS